MPDYKPVHTDQPPEWHRQRFVEFLGYKRLVGEPSPHMTIAGWMCDQDHARPKERLWRAGVYGAPYSIITSEAVWREWPWDRAVRATWQDLFAWVRANWQGFHIRTERRMVRTPQRMTDNLLSWRDWLVSGELERLDALQGMVTPNEFYDEWYASISKNVMYFGRYITIRVVEFMRRHAGVPAELHDIRSIGGESPVRCLSLLYPDYSHDLLVRKDGRVAERVANWLLDYCRAEYPDTGHYVLAAMLCEYREAYEDNHQYPGRTIDQELTYANGPAMEWWSRKGYESQLWAARQALFPKVALGEHMGWQGIRHDLSRYLTKYLRNWSDIKYVYPSLAERVS